MNVGEFGVVFRMSVGFDIHAFSNLSITFTKPDKTTLTVGSPNVSVGGSDVATTLGTFLANQYALYTFQNGDVTQAGSWTARLTYQDTTPRQLISTPGTFTINP